MRAVKKAHLPSKTCPVCGRPFSWRKKWERDWEQVVYCSRRCRGDRARADDGHGRAGSADRSKPDSANRAADG